MKLSTSVLILLSPGLASIIAYSQQPAADAPTRAQEVLRQSMSQPDPSAANVSSLPTRDELLADIKRLHGEGRITDQQLELLTKNINEQYLRPAAAPPSEPRPAAAAPPSRPAPAVRAETSAPQRPREMPRTEAAAAGADPTSIAEQELRRRMAELNAAQPAAAASPSRPSTRVQAETPTPAVSAGTNTSSIAEQALRRRMAELNATQPAAAAPAVQPAAQAQPKPPAPEPQPPAVAQTPRVVTPPQRATPPPAATRPDTSALAEQALHQRMSELNRPSSTSTPPGAREAAPPRVERPAAASPQVVAETPRPVVTRSMPQRELRQPDTSPAPAATLTPEQEARVREILAARNVPAQSEVRPAPAPAPGATLGQPAPAAAPQPQPPSSPQVEATVDTSDKVALLRTQMAQLDANTGAGAPSSSPTRTPPPAVVASPSVEPAIDPSDKVALLRRQMAQMDSRTGSAPPATSAVMQPAMPMFAPAARPSVAIETSNPEGLQQLRELTERYRRNQITPAEYHRERAKIVPTL